MKLDEVKSYADLAECFCEQGMMVRGCAIWHANARHRQKASELNAKANWFADIYRKMLELSDKEQKEGGAA